MRFKRKIAPETKFNPTYITKKRLKEDQINFDRLRECLEPCVMNVNLGMWKKCNK